MSAELGLDIFLAVLEKEEMGLCENDYDDDYYYSKKNKYKGWRKWDEQSSEEQYDDEGDGADWHDLDDVHETSCKFKRIADLKGRPLLTELPCRYQ